MFLKINPDPQLPKMLLNNPMLCDLVQKDETDFAVILIKTLQSLKIFGGYSLLSHLLGDIEV
jgi:hypothetical protein